MLVGIGKLKCHVLQAGVRAKRKKNVYELGKYKPRTFDKNA